MDSPRGTPELEITAVVLAGGRGVRLGRRKETVRLPSHPGAPPSPTLLDLQLHRWSSLVPRLAVSAREPLPQPLPPGVETILDPPEATSVIDALRAILAHLAPRGDAAWVVAVDCPIVPPTIARTVISAWEPGRSIFITTDCGPEMLCGLYDPSALSGIDALIESGERRLSRITEEVPSRVLLYPADFPPLGTTTAVDLLAARLGPFHNVNHPADLTLLEQALTSLPEGTPPL
ncbi:MAG: NTP transferase domain-containing protein [Planctomycetota bacterium]|jgi:molybdopterin-guanine dinucleotide biosynthesis protein A